MYKYRRPLVFVGTRLDMEPLIDIPTDQGIPILGILDRFYLGQKFEGLDVLGSDLDLINPESNPIKDLVEYADFFVVTYFAGIINAESDSENMFQLRAKRIELVKHAGCNLINLLHPDSTVSKTAQLGRNILTMPGSRIESHTKVGSFSQFMYNTVVAHHSVVGENCALMPSAGISGSITLGKNVFLGIQSSVLSTTTPTVIGDNVMIAPSVTVLKDIPDNSIVQLNGKILPNKKFTEDVYDGMSISSSYKRLS